MDRSEGEALVLEMLHAISDRDPDALAARLHPDVRWWFQRSIAQRNGWAHPIVGIPEVLRVEFPPTSAFEPGSTTWEIHLVLADGDRVAVLLERVARMRDGSIYRVEYDIVARVRDGLVVELWNHIDTLAATGNMNRL